MMVVTPFSDTFNEDFTCLVSQDEDLFCLSKSEKIHSLNETKTRLDLFEFAQNLLTIEIEAWSRLVKTQKPVPGRNRTLLLNLLHRGTVDDKINTLEHLIKESPLHNIDNLAHLVEMCSKKGRRECIPAIDLMTKLLTEILLPDRKLLDFSANLKRHQRDRVSHKELVLMAYENNLKNLYQKFVDILELTLKDSLPKIRSKISGIVLDLLISKPENEQRLLSMLVNKLGDQDRSVASHVIYLLLKLIQTHGKMSGVIIEEIRLFLLRSNLDPKTQHYGLCVMNQIIFTRDNQELASNMINIYFSFFEKHSKKEEGFNQKILTSLLRGINRAYPYAKCNDEKTENHVNYLYKIVQVGSLAVSIQAMTLLYNFLTKRCSSLDKYFQLLYSKLFHLLSAEGMNHCVAFMNIAEKSLSADKMPTRIRSFIKRLLQVCVSGDPPVACSLLLTLSRLYENDRNLFRLVNKTQSQKSISKILTETDELESFDDQPTVKKRSNDVYYRIEHHDPLTCGSQHTDLWELSLLTRHSHLSIRKFSEMISQSEKLIYTGDPWEDFSQRRYLDRFLSKNIKTTNSNEKNCDLKNKQRKSVENTSSFCSSMDVIDDCSRFALSTNKKIFKRTRNKMSFENSDDSFDQDFNVDFIEEGEKSQKHQNFRHSLKKKERSGDSDLDSFSSQESDSSKDSNSDLSDDDSDDESDSDKRKPPVNYKKRKMTNKFSFSENYSQKFKRKRLQK